MQRTISKPSPIGEFLKCQKPENYFTEDELKVMKNDYNTAIQNRLWQADVLPPCKKASSALEGQLLMSHILKSCDRSLVCFLTLNEIAGATGLTVYRVRQLIKALDEVNIIVYAKSSIQLLPVPKGTISALELYLQHYNARERFQ